MNAEKISTAINNYRNAAAGSERSKIFFIEIYPLIEDMLNGVILTLHINTLSQEDIEDLKQTVYLKLLSKLDIEDISGIRSLKNYMFIRIKNIVLDYLRSDQRLKQFFNHIKNEYEKEYKNESDL